MEKLIKLLPVALESPLGDSIRWPEVFDQEVIEEKPNKWLRPN
jgi:hypothetical protein